MTRRAGVLDAIEPEPVCSMHPLDLAGMGAKPGDQVEEGQTLATLAFRHPGRLPDALKAIEGAFEIGDEPPPFAPLVLERIG